MLSPSPVFPGLRKATSGVRRVLLDQRFELEKRNSHAVWPARIKGVPSPCRLETDKLDLRATPPRALLIAAAHHPTVHVPDRAGHPAGRVAQQEVNYRAYV